MTLFGCEKIGTLTKDAQGKLQQVCTTVFGCAAPLIVTQGGKQHFFCDEFGQAVWALNQPHRGIKPSQIEELILNCKQGTEQFNIAQTF